MKKVWLFIVLTGSVLSLAAQSGSAFLTAPASWQFEQFFLPPGFAPTVPYHGREELRFSPGWDKKDAKDYFTVIWGFRFDDTKSVSSADIRSFLQTYFRGLCSSTAKNRHLPAVDTSAITVAIEKKPGAGKTIIYNLSLHLFGVFADGDPVTLNGEIKQMEDAAHGKVYLLMVASPQPKTDPVWGELYKELREIGIPAN